MSGGDEDDKPTVVLDLNALKQQKLKQEEELNNIVSELEFNIPQVQTGDLDSEAFAEHFLIERKNTETSLSIVLFDFQSDFFERSLKEFPQGHEYKVVNTLPELNQCLKSKEFQIVVFNYDVNPKAVNQLTAQIKRKKPNTKTIIMARKISPEKAKLHARTPSGAHGYFQLPLTAEKIEDEFQKIYSKTKKAS